MLAETNVHIPADASLTALLLAFVVLATVVAIYFIGKAVWRRISSEIQPTVNGADQPLPPVSERNLGDTLLGIAKDVGHLNSEVHNIRTGLDRQEAELLDQSRMLLAQGHEIETLGGRMDRAGIPNGTNGSHDLKAVPNDPDQAAGAGG